MFLKVVEVNATYDIMDWVVFHDFMILFFFLFERVKFRCARDLRVVIFFPPRVSQNQQVPLFPTMSRFTILLVLSVLAMFATASHVRFEESTQSQVQVSMEADALAAALQSVRTFCLPFCFF
jgi:hypothetical protein